MNVNVETPAADPEENAAPQTVNLDEVTDLEQLRAIMENPSNADREKEAAGKEENAQDPPTEGGEPAGEGEGEGEGSKEGTSQQEGADSEESGNPGEDDHKALSGTRVKVRAAHLDDAQRTVLKLVSQKRLSIPEAQELVVADLVRAGKSLKEAEAAVFFPGGRRVAEAPAAPEKQPGETEPPAGQTEDPLAAKQQEVAEIEDALAKAEADYNVTEAAELRRKLRTAERELIRLEFEAKEQATQKVTEAEKAYMEAVEKSSARAIEHFPDAEKEGTELFEAIADEVEDLKESNPDFFKNPDWPFTLAAKNAALLGIPSAKHKAGATSAQGGNTVAKPPKKAARTITPASGASGGSTTTTTEALTLEQELEAAGDDPAKIREILRKAGTRSFAE